MGRGIPHPDHDAIKGEGEPGSQCHSNNIYQKDMCLKEVGLCGQIMIINLGSIFNIYKYIFFLGGGLYNQIMNTRIFTLIMNRKSYKLQKR